MSTVESTAVILALAIFALLVLVSSLLYYQKKEIAALSDQLSRCTVRTSNLEEECRRLAWGAFDQLRSMKRDFESRSSFFYRQMQGTPHKDHEQRAVGYREASATLGRMIEEMEKRGEGEQKIKVDL